MEELAKVFTKGAQKYEPRNWEKGMSWQSVLASLERHKEAFKKGEDKDEETGLLHMAHVAWNALALVSYYSIYPQGDDRQHEYVRHPKIGLDIDDVLCDWVGAWAEKYNILLPTSWYFDYEIREKFKEMERQDELIEFYLGLQPKIKPEDLKFEPHAYVTSRPVSSEITMQWLEIYEFPLKPVYTVELGGSKVDAIKGAGIEIFVDDNYYNFVDLNKNGVCCFLFSAEHNKKFDAGYKRISNLNELIK